MEVMQGAHSGRWVWDILSGPAAGNHNFVLRGVHLMASEKYNIVKERMDGGEVILLDGAISTEIEKRGVVMDRLTWSGMGSKTGSETLLEVHKDYIRAGADVITTNTFSSARHSLATAGHGEETREINALAVALARQAVEEAGEGKTVLVAGSISPFGAYTEIAGFETPPLEVLKDSYREQAEILAEEGVDLLLLEMLRDVERASVIVEAALSTGIPVWSGFSSQVEENGSVMALGDYTPGGSVVFGEMFEGLMGLGGDMGIVMHSEVEHIAPTLEVMGKKWDGPLGAYAHSGHWNRPNWDFDSVISPENYLEAARGWVAAGARLIGGCCGIGPDHIRLLNENLSQVPTAS